MISFEEAIKMEAKCIPLVVKEILNRATIFKDITFTKFYCGQKRLFREWVRILRNSKDGEFEGQLSDFESDRRDKYIDEAFHIDGMLRKEVKFMDCTVGHRILVQCRMLTYTNINLGYKSVTFSPSELFNFRGNYFIHGYCGLETDGAPEEILTWIIYDFLGLRKLILDDKIIKPNKNYLPSGKPFLWVPYEDVIKHGLALAYDVGYWDNEMKLDKYVMGVEGVS